MSLSLSSGSISSSLETVDMNSSSVSMLEEVVTGVGGAVSGPAEARTLLLGAVIFPEEIVASAAFRFLVAGMVPAYIRGWGSVGNATRGEEGRWESGRMTGNDGL